MKLIKETYLLFLIVIGLFSLSIYSTYSLFVEEYSVGIVSTTASGMNFDLSNVTEHKRIDTYPGESRNIKLNLYNSTGTGYYYGVYVKNYIDCIGLIYDSNYSDIRGYIDNDVSKTISLDINNTCDYSYSFDLYVVNSNQDLSSTDKFDDGMVVITSLGNVDKDSDLDIDISNIESEDSTAIKLGDYVFALYDSNEKIIKNVNKEDISFSVSNFIFKDSYDNLRYYGNKANNYILFNGELWRIMGLFYQDDSLTLVKIIKDESLGLYSFDINSWKESSINNILNGDYYNKLEKVDRDKILKVKYYLNVSNDLEFNGANDYYNMERNGNYFYEGYLGLMYPSDYIYSYYSDSCDYDKDSYIKCGSWLEKDDLSEFTITLNNELIYSVSSSGLALNKTISDKENIRPVIYLDSNVILKSGSGTLDDPYVLS